MCQHAHGQLRTHSWNRAYLEVAVHYNASSLVRLNLAPEGHSSSSSSSGSSSSQRTSSLLRLLVLSNTCDCQLAATVLGRVHT
jgi:hypothetical protein